MKMKKGEYEDLLKPLQVELARLQDWIVDTGQRVIVLFEGRDTAGKGGSIRALSERVSKRVFRTVALPKPSNREKGQWYPQRYVQHFPSDGEVILFDRSWYNRAGVERVMGFCTQKQVARFLRETPGFESALVESGIHLLKYWLEISPDSQEERLRERMQDPRKHWKLSDMDMESHHRWYSYSMARDEMLKYTDTEDAPWHIVQSDDQRRARLNLIAHLLDQFDYRADPPDIPELPAIDDELAYDDSAAIKGRNFIPGRY